MRTRSTRVDSTKQVTIYQRSGGMIKEFWTIGGIYFIWISLHFGATHLYSYLCAHPTLIGFLSSPFVTSTPICSALRWTIYQGADMINTMWGVLGTWLVAKIVKLK
jgi:hypothetical protein